MVMIIIIIVIIHLILELKRKSGTPGQCGCGGHWRLPHPPWHSVVPEDSTPGRLLRIVASIAPPLLSGARARDLSNLAWAFATLDLRKFDSVGQRDPRKTWGKIHENS